MDFFAKKVNFRPFLVIFRYFPLLSVTSFTLKEGHNDRWSLQEYSRGPLETFVLSFTRLNFGSGGQNMDFFPKRSVFAHFWPKNGQKVAIFRKIHSGKTNKKSSRKLFTSYVLFVYVPTYQGRCR